jgi:hypothetical protein
VDGDGARLDVGVDGVAPRTELEHHLVAGEVDRLLHMLRRQVRHLVRHVVAGEDDRPVAHREQVRAEVGVLIEAGAVALEVAPVAQLHEVDRERLGQDDPIAIEGVPQRAMAVGR